MDNVDKPIHAHCSWFGSELACQICNPVCYEKHQMDNPNHLQWCGHPDCPMNPENIKKKMAECYKENADEDLALAKEFEGTLSDGLEEEEDDIRKSKRKSIRIQGKYKGRGKTKRREP